MSAKIVNLTELQEVRAKMTPGVLEVCCPDQPESHPCRLVWNDQDEPAFSMTRDPDEDGVPKADVAGLVATHNAADVLIEVARAAKRLRSAEMATLKARMAARTEGNASALADATDTERAAADEYDAALAKVSL